VLPETANSVEFYALRPTPKLLFLGGFMAALTELTTQLLARSDLSAGQIEVAVTLLSSLAETDENKAAFLTALATKGETPGELAGFAAAFRELAVNPGVDAFSPHAIDIVGTGGDLSGGFNISSLVVLVLASAGVPVMKHGNRGITSKSGSADLLAALGVDIAASPEKSRRALTELGYAFFFAPNYHPAFKNISPVRKALAAQGRRSIFNILGPLVNPGRPAHILLGVYSRPLVATMSGALEQLGQTAGLVAHGVIGTERGIDELTTATVNHVRGVGRLDKIDTTWRAEDHGLTTSPFSHLVGGDVAANLLITEAILAGRAPVGLIDTIVLNAAVGLYVVGRVADVREGIVPARDLLLGGAVARKIAATKEFYHA